MSDEIIYRELSYAINGCIFEVHNELGPGLREECYQKAMQIRLAEIGLPYVCKPFTRQALHHRGKPIEIFEPDAIIDGRIILELKALRNGFSNKDYSQALAYIKFWDTRLGLLINFAQSVAIIKRLPNLTREIATSENYQWIEQELNFELRTAVEKIREAILTILGEFGCGYSESTYRKLVEPEFCCCGLECQSTAKVFPTFHQLELPASLVTPFIVSGGILVEILAIHDEISATAIRTMQTHLRLTNCRIGLIACFGKTRFSIRGVRR